MSELKAGTKVRFKATLKVGGKAADAKGLKATVTYDGEVHHFTSDQLSRDDTGVYTLDFPVSVAGPLVVTFKTATGEEQTAQYEVTADPQLAGTLAAAPARPIAEEVDRVFSWMKKQLQQQPVEAAPPPAAPPPASVPSEPRFDRAAARSRLLAAGYPVDESWSNVKLQAALEGLDQRERERRVWGF